MVFRHRLKRSCFHPPNNEKVGHPLFLFLQNKLDQKIFFLIFLHRFTFLNYLRPPSFLKYIFQFFQFFYRKKNERMTLNILGEQESGGPQASGSFTP